MGIVAQRYRLMYDQGRVDKQGLHRAVQRGLMTAEEYKEIADEDFPA